MGRPELSEIYKAIDSAESEMREEVADNMLKKYTASDRDLIAPWVYEYAATGQHVVID